MQRVQRKFGSFLPRTADETQIATLLNDFKEADQMLVKVPFLRYLVPEDPVDNLPDHRRCQSLARSMGSHSATPTFPSG